jgi:hypothetical protein
MRNWVVEKKLDVHRKNLLICWFWYDLVDLLVFFGRVRKGFCRGLIVVVLLLLLGLFGVLRRRGLRFVLLGLDVLVRGLLDLDNTARVLGLIIASLNISRCQKRRGER